MRTSRTARRCADERGAAIVEFALIVPVVLLFLFGIITFGLILSFKQGITQAAAEGARAAAVAEDAAQAQIDARSAATDAISAFGKDCDAPGDGLSCVVETYDCANPTVSADGFDDCARVRVTYDYSTNPLIAPLPFISAALPETIESTSVARMSDRIVTP